MAAADPNAATTPPHDPTNHGQRVVVAWILLSAIATPLVAIFVGHLIPPGDASAQGTEQVFDNTWMLSVITPIVCLLLVFFVYGLRSFRATSDAVVDGPPLRNDSRIQILWIIGTGVIVLFLAGFGTYELLQNGAGGGQGPDPIAVPAGPKFQVQVIAQQWQFTYRYPSLGNVESNQLVLPADTDVELHVTSLDAVHSFWAYELGVKADANPGVDNVVFVKTKSPTTFHVRCAELCGLWHPYMFNNGKVVDHAQFTAWAAGAKKLYAAIKPFMDKPTSDGGAPFAHIYFPAPDRRAG
jgi:cytochrome c oxidase subunit 2